MIKIKKAKSKNMETILKLQHTAYQSEAEICNDFTIQPLTQTLDELIEEYHKGIILKATLNDKIIGSVRAYADGDTVYIGKLMIHPEHQGKEFGRLLLAAIEEKLHRKKFELFTSCKSERNLQLYKKAGYKRFKEETNDAGIRFVYMEKQAEDEPTNIAISLPLGMALGVLIGVLTDNLALWLSVGLCLGAAVGSAIPLVKTKLPVRIRKRKANENDDGKRVFYDHNDLP